MPKRRAPLPGQNGPPGLTPKMETAAVALAAGHTLEQASKASGAGVTTLKTWQSLPAFVARVRELRAELTGHVLGRVARGMLTAVDTLEHLCANGETETTQLRAAEAMLTHGTALTEVADLRVRLDALERQSTR